MGGRTFGREPRPSSDQMTREGPTWPDLWPGWLALVPGLAAGGIVAVT